MPLKLSSCCINIGNKQEYGSYINVNCRHKSSVFDGIDLGYGKNDKCRVKKEVDNFMCLLTCSKECNKILL